MSLGARAQILNKAAAAAAWRKRARPLDKLAPELDACPKPRWPNKPPGATRQAAGGGNKIGHHWRAAQSGHSRAARAPPPRSLKIRRAPGDFERKAGGWQRRRRARFYRENSLSSVCGGHQAGSRRRPSPCWQPSASLRARPGPDETRSHNERAGAPAEVNRFLKRARPLVNASPAGRGDKMRR